MILLFLILFGSQSYAQDSISIHLNLHDSISTQEASDLKIKIEKIAEKLFEEFQLKKGEIFTIHIWKNYPDYLSAQKVNLGVEYPGSAGYIFGTNDLAIFYGENMADNAEHEFVHSASLRLNSEFGNNPRWFWEAVAIYESDEFIHPKELDYLVNGDFPSLEELNGMISKDGANKIYDVGYLLSEFIIEKWGRKKYLKLIQNSGELDGILSIDSKSFEAQWKEFVQNKYLK